MSSRERVLAAIARQAPDRTPRDFWVEAATWNRLFAACRPRRQRQRLLNDLGIDIRHLEIRDPPKHPAAAASSRTSGASATSGGTTPWGPVRDDGPGALAGATTLDQLESFDWPTPRLFDYSGLMDQCRRLDSYALLYGFADVWQRPALVRGWENMFFDMMDRPEWAHFLCRKFADFYCEDYPARPRPPAGESTFTCC